MNTFLLFLVCTGLGFLVGAVYGVLGFVKLLTKNNFIINNIINFLFGIGVGMVVLITTINLNYGMFRWFIIVGFVVGVLFERKTLGKLFAKIFLFLYNRFSRGLTTLKNTKVVKRILK